MFEQQSYEYYPAPPPPPLAEGDLFHHYEIRSWDLTPRIFKILAISAVFNIAVVLFAAQTSLLTLKGCDSPLVGSVCQALDTVYVSSLLFGTQREYVDAVYDKTKLGADDDITFVDVSKETPPLTYPAGYFELANPEQFQELALIDNSVDDLEGSGFTNGNIPGIPPGIPLSHPNNGSSLFDTPQTLPHNNPHVLEGQLPGAGNHNGFTPPKSPRRGLGGRVTPPAAPHASPTGTPDETVAGNKNPTTDPNGNGNKVDPTEPITDAQINKRPFVDLANYINDLLDKNEVKLDSQFAISATGKLDKDGKLDPKSFKYLKAESTDVKMLEVVKEAIEAMNASGYLQYLKDLSGKNLTIQILQDNDNVGALIKSDLESDNKAKTISSGLNMLIGFKKQAKEAPTADQNDKDDLVLLQNAAVTAQGKTLVIGFNIPKADIQRMIQRKLAEQKAQPKPDETTTPVKPGTSVG
jgi:hypothetical protein